MLPFGHFPMTAPLQDPAALRGRKASLAHPPGEFKHARRGRRHMYPRRILFLRHATGEKFRIQFLKLTQSGQDRLKRLGRLKTFILMPDGRQNTLGVALSFITVLLQRLPMPDKTADQKNQHKNAGHGVHNQHHTAP